MTLNARLNLESLDGRWLPDATPTTPPTLPPHSLPPNSTLMDTPEFRAQLAKVQESLSELDGICRKYAEREVSHISAKTALEALQDELNRRIAAGENQGDLPAQIAIDGALVRGLAAAAAIEAAKYPPQVAVVNAEIAALNALVPGANFSFNVSALEKYVLLETITHETTPPAIPPGVG